MWEKKAYMIHLPKVVDPRGNLTVAEQGIHVPFDIARVYWTYDIPGGESRGGHAHRHCEEVIIAASGSFDATLDKGIWRTLDDFSSGAVCLVLTSELFDEDDYVRDYDTFAAEKKAGK